MSASLSHVATIAAESVTDPRPLVLTRMEFVSDGAGNYVLSTSNARDAGFVLTGGNYVFTPGRATNLTLVRTANGNVTSYR